MRRWKPHGVGCRCAIA